jgi:hypothetical protein
MLSVKCVCVVIVPVVENTKPLPGVRLAAKGVPVSTASARVKRLDYRGECLLVRVKLACGSTEANGRV